MYKLHLHEYLLKLTLIYKACNIYEVSVVTDGIPNINTLPFSICLITFFFIKGFDILYKFVILFIYQFF